MRNTFRNADGFGAVRCCQHRALCVLGLAEIEGWSPRQQGLSDQLAGEVGNGLLYAMNDKRAAIDMVRMLCRPYEGKVQACEVRLTSLFASRLLQWSDSTDPNCIGQLALSSQSSSSLSVPRCWRRSAVTNIPMASGRYKPIMECSLAKRVYVLRTESR